MRLQDYTLANIPRLAASGACCWTPLRRSKWPEFVTTSMIRRMAHLIIRMETNPNIGTAIGAKWVLANLIRPFGAFSTYLDPFVERLQETLTQYEEHCGVVDEGHFARMIALAGYTPERILIGGPILFVGGPCFDGSPHLEVARTISYQMWRQAFD